MSNWAMRHDGSIDQSLSDMQDPSIRLFTDAAKAWNSVKLLENQRFELGSPNERGFVQWQIRGLTLIVDLNIYPETYMTYGEILRMAHPKGLALTFEDIDEIVFARGY